MTRHPTLRRLWRAILDAIFLGRIRCRRCSSHKRVHGEHVCQHPWTPDGRPIEPRTISPRVYARGRAPSWCPRRRT